MDGKEAIKRLEKQYKRQNEYIKNSYDRVSITLPKGTKSRIKATGNTINGLVNTLLLEYLDKCENNAPDPQTVSTSAEDPQLPTWGDLPEELPPLED